MQSISRLTAVIATVVLSIALWSTTTLGATRDWDIVDVTVQTDPNGQPVMLISGELPAGASLPADVELAAPTGSTIQWAGEILGGAPEQDPTVQYQLDNRDGMDVYQFKLTKARMGQIEVTLPGLIAQTPEGFRSNLTWTASGPAKELRLSVRIPQNAQVLEVAEGAALAEGPTGYKFYSKTLKDVKKGQTETLQFTYSAASQPATAPTANTAGSGNMAVGIILVLVAGVIVLMMLNVNKKIRSKGATGQVEATRVQKSPAAKSTAPKAASKRERVAESPAEPNPAPGTVPGAKKQQLVIALVVAVLGIGATIAFTSGGKATVTGDTISLQIAQVDACTRSSIPLTTPSGADLTKDADGILSRLKSVSGVGDATIYVKESRIEINYCKSITSEGAIMAALVPSGYVSADTSVTTTPATAQ